MENSKITLKYFQENSDPFYLVEFWIGPSPRDFMAESRKLRDLATSSLLISLSMCWILDNILKKYEHDIILLPHINPDHILLPSHFSKKKFPKLSVLNRCVCLLQNEDLDIIKNIEWKNNFGHVVNAALARLGNIISQAISANIFQHWQNFFHIRWVAHAMNKEGLSSDHFAQELQSLQNLVARRKLTRDFLFWQGSYLPKCTLCARREVIMGSFSQISLWDILLKKYPEYFKDNERLCGICLIKRLITPKLISPSLNFALRFDSTSDACCAILKKWLRGNLVPFEKIPEIQKILSKFYPEYYKSLCTVFEENFPADLLYLETLCDFKSQLEKRTITTRQKQDLKKERQKILEITQTREVPSYYVLLRLDADFMGRWMSGDKNFCREFNLSILQKFSQSLHYLANVLYPFVIEKIWGGQVIFSSGDELLAFGPVWGGPIYQDAKKKILFPAIIILELLRDIFDYGTEALKKFIKRQLLESDNTIELQYEKANDLREFKRDIGKLLEDELNELTEGKDEFLQKGFRTIAQEIAQDKYPTITGGLMLAHRHSVLKYSLEKCFYAEELSKERLGTDGLTCITLIHSGSPLVLASKWNITGYSFSQCFENLIYPFLQIEKKYRFSAIWFYDLYNEARQLFFLGKGSNINKTFHVFRNEIGRFLERHRCSDEKYYELQRNIILKNMDAIIQAIYIGEIVTDKKNDPGATLESWLRTLAFWIRTYRAVFVTKDADERESTMQFDQF